MDLSGLDSSLPAGLADAERDMTDKFRAAALSITNLYKTSLANTKQAYQVGYSAALADVLSKVQSDIGAGEDAAVALARLMDWTEARQTAISAFAQDDEDVPPSTSKPRPRPSSAPASSVPARFTAPGPSSLSQRADMEDDTPRSAAQPTSSPILSPAPCRPGVKSMRSLTRVPQATPTPPQAASFNFSVPIPVNVIPTEGEAPSQIGPVGGKRPMVEPQGEPSTPRNGRAAKRRNAMNEDEGQGRQRSARGSRRRGPSPPSSVSS